VIWGRGKREILRGSKMNLSGNNKREEKERYGRTKESKTIPDCKSNKHKMAMVECPVHTSNTFVEK